MLNDKNQLVTSPAYGAVVALTGYGQTPSEALAGPEALAKRAKIPDKMYRTDMVQTLEKDIQEFDRLVSTWWKGPVGNPLPEEHPSAPENGQ
jgi:hypothetical protein